MKWAALGCTRSVFAYDLRALRKRRLWTLRADEIGAWAVHA